MVNSGRILIVDDEPKIRTLFRRFLNESGYKSLTASDGAEAFKILKKNRDIDMIVLDINLPKRSGLDVFDAIHKKFPEVKVIISSVYSKDEQQFLIEDADAYYYKTDSLSILVDKIRELKSVKQAL